VPPFLSAQLLNKEGPTWTEWAGDGKKDNFTKIVWRQEIY